MQQVTSMKFAFINLLVIFKSDFVLLFKSEMGLIHAY